MSVTFLSFKTGSPGMFLTAEIAEDILTYLCVLRAFFASSAVKKTEKAYTQMKSADSMKIAISEFQILRRRL